MFYCCVYFPRSIWDLWNLINTRLTLWVNQSQWKPLTTIQSENLLPGWDFNNLLKHLPGDTLKITNSEQHLDLCGFPSSVSGEQQLLSLSPNQTRATVTHSVINRHIDLTICLCKVLECMINTRFPWYVEKSGILDRMQCAFRKHCNTVDHLVDLKRYASDAFARRWQTIGLFVDVEKSYEKIWQYGIIRDLHMVCCTGRLPVVLSEYLREGYDPLIKPWIYYVTRMAELPVN